MELVILYIVVFGISTIIGLLCCIAGFLKLIYNRPVPKPPDSKIISQAVVVKAQADITTVQPTTLGSTTCSHRWDKLAEEKLSTIHEECYVLVLKCDSCGTLDKTSKILTKKVDCSHDWDDEKSVRLESAFEQLVKAASDHKGFDFKLKPDELPRDFFRKVYLKVKTCKNCGQVNVIKAANYDLEESVEE